MCIESVQTFVHSVQNEYFGHDAHLDLFSSGAKKAHQLNTCFPLRNLRGGKKQKKKKHRDNAQITAAAQCPFSKEGVNCSPGRENMVNSIHCLLIVSTQNVTHFTCQPPHCNLLLVRPAIKRCMGHCIHSFHLSSLFDARCRNPCRVFILSFP